MLPVFIPASKDIRDYLRSAESLLDKFTDALLAVPHELIVVALKSL
jgi:hypothetical protein